MHHLTIYKRIFYNSDCYKTGTIQRQRGVQVHSTGANNPNLRRYVSPDDGRLGLNPNNNSHNRPGNVCASAYIGKLRDGTVATYQALPWDMRCWLSGNGKNGNANRLGYAGFEICEDALHDESYFLAVMNQAILLTAHLCQLFDTTPDAIVKETPEGPALAVMDHSELHKVGLASNHGDVKHWMRNFGWTMDMFREKVSGAMAEGIDVEYIDCDKEGDDEPMEDAIFRAVVTAPSGKTVNLRAQPSTKATVMARVPIGMTVDVLEETSAEWWRVRYAGNTGYMMACFLQPEDAPEEQPDETPSEETVPISVLKLKEMRSCLAILLQDVEKALQEAKA